MRDPVPVRACLLAGLFLAMAGRVPLLAHHSFAAEFDDARPLKLTGTLTKVEWNNPHIWYYIDVMNPDGTVTTWAFSGGAPGQLMRRGITKDLLKSGSTVVVEGFRAKDGSTNGFGSRITYPDGRNVLTATSQDRQAAPPNEGQR
jgi:hypothetical protein